MERLVEELGGIDFMFLGIGINGHLGLNEPGCDFEQGPHTTALSETTKTVGQKYFSSHADLQGGITLGIRDIMNSRRVGSHLPATVLRRHGSAALYLDAAAAQGIQGTSLIASGSEVK